MSGRPPRCYFSLRSPYSWLAYRDLRDRHPDVAARLEWLPFWEPDARSGRMLAEAGGEFPYSPMSRAKHLYVLQDVRRQARHRGLDVTWPVDREPCWEVPHLGYLAAGHRGLAGEFMAACYRARWQEGRDICRPSTIAEIAAALGLPPAETAAAADDPALRVEGVEALLAVHRDGVFGVPFLIHGHARFWGIDRVADFVAEVRDTPPAGAVAAFDDGHAGGCG